MKKIFILFSGIFLSACAGIPSSAPINFGPEINSTESDQFIQVIGRPPSIGMEPKELITGFLSTLADSRDDYSVAKEYLLPEASSIWRPNSGITVYDSANLNIDITGEKVIVSAPKFGEIDSSGHLTLDAVGSQAITNFDLSKNSAGEWRIANLPDGVLLSSNDVERSFKGYPVYFLSPDRKRLVADTVLLPQSITGSATALVQALINGPSTKLELATVNSFPTATNLTYGLVPVTNGVATVDLTSQVLNSDQSLRAQMAAQLVWTLNSLPNVNSVEIQVSGQPLEISALPNIQSAKDWPLFNPLKFDGSENLHFLRNNNVISYSADGTESIVASVSPAFQMNINQTQGTVDGNSIAAASSDHKKVLAVTGRGGQFEVVGSGDAISKPSWDQTGSIFYSDYGVGVFEINSKKQTRRVEFDSPSFINPNQIKQVSIANDGVRIALVASIGSTDFLLGGAIVKTESSTRIVGLRILDRTINSIVDLDWQSPTSIAVLGSDASGGNLVFDLNLATGTSTSILAPVNAQTISTSLGKQLYVGTISGSKSMIAKQSGSSWIDLVEGSSPYIAR